MKRLIVAVAVSCLLSTGCATFSEKAKMEAFGRTMDAYETAMRTSELNDVCQFVDPAHLSRADCLQRFGEVKLVDYELMDVHVDKDRLTVDQEVNVAYHYQNHYRIKEIRYRQTWSYLEAREAWFLEDGPPTFE